MIIQLLQALYEPRTTLPVDSAFYEQSLVDIEYFGVSSQMYWLLKERGLLEQTPEFFQVRLLEKFMAVLYQNMLIKSQTERILRAFDEAGIEAIPLKGVAFAEKYFGHAGARGTSDIDLLIQPVDLERAIAYVKSLGFMTEEERIPFHFHRGLLKAIPGAEAPLRVELHWGLLKERTSRLRIEEFWQQAEPLKQYRYIKALSDYHTFYFICLHGWRHNLSSLKYILDIVRVIVVLQGEPDYSVLFRDAASHKTLRRIKWTLGVVYHYLPQLGAIKPLPLRSGRIWWNYDAIRGLKYKKANQYANIVFSQYLALDSVLHSLQAIRSEFSFKRTD